MTIDEALRRYGIAGRYLDNQTDENWLKLRDDVAPGYADLLKACKELSRLIEQFVSGALVTWPVAILPQVKAIIAKAEGVSK